VSSADSMFEEVSKRFQCVGEELNASSKGPFSCYHSYSLPQVLQSYSRGGGPKLIFINHTTIHHWKLNLAALHILQHWPSACVSACLVSTNSFSLLFHMIPPATCGLGACWPVSPGRRKPISTSSIIQLSPCLPSHEHVNFVLIGKLLHDLQLLIQDLLPVNRPVNPQWIWVTTLLATRQMIQMIYHHIHFDSERGGSQNTGIKTKKTAVWTLTAMKILTFKSEGI
jgi:hypothetical protein